MIKVPYPSSIKIGGIFMSHMNSQSHLTLDERIMIETGITNGAKKTEIAATIGKDKSTVGKEIKNHRILNHHNSYPTDCKIFQKCRDKHDCHPDSCPQYSPFKCSRRDRSPGACNGCSKYQHCRYDKYRYSAHKAHDEYRTTLIDTRVGVDLTVSEAKKLGDIIKPLLEQGQSPYQIITGHPELGISEKTLYNYINDGVLSVSGISNIDLRKKVGRKIKKNKAVVYKKREDNSFLKGRTYNDYNIYMDENPYMSVIQMDTVYNDVSSGPFLQTFEFTDFGFTFALIHDEKTSLEMVKGMDILENITGRDLLMKYAPVCLTDRGAEFSDAEGFEGMMNGSRRTRIFYCDPMQSGQKGALENSHKEIRYICPKKTDLRAIGLTDQNAVNLMMSHINSFSRESLKGKSPIEMMKFLAPELFEKFEAFGIIEIEKDKVILKPYLLKR